jgi:hypothetical protein
MWFGKWSVFHVWSHVFHKLINDDRPYVHNAGVANSTWNPIPALNRTDADVSILFMSQNSLTYYKPVYDPWFLANGSFYFVKGELLLPNHFVNVMACADQYRICNPTTGGCTPYVGNQQLQLATSEIHLNSEQVATVQRLVNSVSGIYDSVDGLGAGGISPSCLPLLLAYLNTCSSHCERRGPGRYICGATSRSVDHRSDALVHYLAGKDASFSCRIHLQ